MLGPDENDERSEDSLAFIVPALNEEGNIAGAVDELRRAAAMAGLAHYEIVLVNDGSTDRTGEIMRGLAARDPNIKYVENATNMSLGGAYKAGVKVARATYVMLVPGDNEHPAEGLLPILRERGKVDIVVPYVLNPAARGWGRRLASMGFTLVVNLMSLRRVPYYNGLVIHRRALLEKIAIRTNGYAYQAEAITKLLKLGHSYVTVGAVIGSRKGGTSKAFELSNILKVLAALWNLFLDVHFRR
ncbi:MAG: glycosyltransferase family 2 protein [Azospirillum sp.]|nr:glycosyltransferase family 2 protein [Azospirillum sp.]